MFRNSSMRPGPLLGDHRFFLRPEKRTSLPSERRSIFRASHQARVLLDYRLITPTQTEIFDSRRGMTSDGDQNTGHDELG
jgi:hypothetical protein